jgi:hypothetical protein
MADAVVTATVPEKTVTGAGGAGSAAPAATPAPATPVTPATPAAPEAAKPKEEPAKTEAKAPWMEPAKKEETKPDAAASQAAVTFEAKDLKLPEGVQMEPARLAEYASFAKESGYSQAQTEKLIARDLAQQKASHDATMNMLKAQDAKWLGDYRQALGDKFAEHGEKLKRVFDYADADGSFRKGLEDMHLAHNPELLKFASKFIPLFEEDRLKGPSSTIPTAEDKRTLDEKLDDRYREKMKNWNPRTQVSNRPK